MGLGPSILSLHIQNCVTTGGRRWECRMKTWCGGSCPQTQTVTTQRPMKYPAIATATMMTQSRSLPRQRIAPEKPARDLASNENHPDQSSNSPSPSPLAPPFNSKQQL